MGRVRESTRKQNIAKTKNVYVIVCEGWNKTEKKYFDNYKVNERNRNFIIQVVPAKDTDPINMLKKANGYVLKNNLNCDDGDRVYILIDVDEKDYKRNQIDKVRREVEKLKYTLILSNPCFEVWYLNHFIFTARIFTNENIIDELSKHIKSYEKNKDYYSMLKSKTDTAIKNSICQEKIHNQLRKKWFDFNPSSDVYKIVEEISANR